MDNSQRRLGECLCTLLMFIAFVLQSALWRYFDESVVKPTTVVFGVGALVTLGIGGLFGLKKIGIL